MPRGEIFLCELLFVIMVMLACTCQGDDGDVDCPDLANKAMLTCNSRIKHAFYQETRNAGYSETKVYCKGIFVTLRKCAQNVTKDFYKHCDRNDDDNRVLEEWFFVVMQYLLLSNYLDVCSYNRSVLENYYQNRGFDTKYPKFNVYYRVKQHVGGVLPEAEKVCGRKILKFCIPKLVNDDAPFEKDQNLCQGLENFVSCFNGRVTAETCVNRDDPDNPDISVLFKKIINKFSQRMIDLYEMDPQQMCYVKSSAIDDKR